MPAASSDGAASFANRSSDGDPMSEAKLSAAVFIFASRDFVGAKLRYCSFGGIVGASVKATSTKPRSQSS
jgi:hypothetical protein